MSPQKIVNAIPLDLLWDPSGGVLDARRVAYVGPDEVRERLRGGEAQLLVADVGFDLVRLEGREVFRAWKEELRPRLVPPRKAEGGFYLEDYPDHSCFVASVWEGPDLHRPTILFERYH